MEAINYQESLFNEYWNECPLATGGDSRERRSSVGNGKLVDFPSLGEDQLCRFLFFFLKEKRAKIHEDCEKNRKNKIK